MTFDFANLAVTATIQSLVSFGIWAAFKRCIEQRDRRLEKLENELVDIRDERIAKIEKRLELEFVKSGECLLVHQQIRDRLLEGAREFKEISDDLSIIRTQVTRLEVNQKLVMERMQLEWRP